jgi:phage shock protein C
VRDRLYRSRTDRMLFGVAGGMADWFDLDPSLVRIVWALLILAGGVGLPLYIIAAIVIPEEPIGFSRSTMASADASGPATGGSGAGAAGSGTSLDPDRSARRQARRAARAERLGNGGGAILFGLILIALGGWFLIDRYLHIDSAIAIPGILIVLGGVLVVGALGRAGRS